MTRRNLIPKLIAIVFCLLGLILLVVALLPLGMLKALLDLLSRDGNLALLRPDNAFAFRLLIGLLGLGIVGLACLIVAQRWRSISIIVKHVWQDFCYFFSHFDISRERGFLPAILLIMVLGVIRRLAYIERPMLHDEAYTVMSFADTLFHAMTDYSLPNNHIFHTILVNLSEKTFGFSPWAVRLPAFLAGSLLIPAVYLFAKRFYDHCTGLVAAVLVAFSPSLIDYSTNARGYTLVALFTLLTLTLGNYVRKEKNLFAWGLLVIFSTLGLYTVPVMLFPFGVLFVWLFLENLAADPFPYPSKKNFFYHWLIAGLLTALFTVLLYTPVLIYTGPEKLFANGFVSALPWKNLLVNWHARLINTWVEWTTGVPILIIISLAIGWILSLVFHRKVSTVRFPLQVAAFLWISCLLIVQRPNAWAKVWVFLLPLMITWSVAGIVGLLKNIRLKLLWNFSLAGILTGIVMIIGIWSAVQLIPKLPGLLAQHSIEENVVLFLKGNISDTDLVVVDVPDDSPVWFYSLQYGVSNKHFDNRIPFQQVWILVDPRYNQTYDKVLADRGPDSPPLDLSTIKLVKESDEINIYLVQVK
jgi:hypothetical protein